MKIAIQNARLAFPNLFTAEQFNGQGEFKYGCSLLLEPGNPSIKAIAEGTDNQLSALALKLDEEFGDEFPAAGGPPAADAPPAGALYQRTPNSLTLAPALAAVVQDLHRLTQGDKSSVQQLADVLLRDAALTTKVESMSLPVAMSY